MKNKDFSVFKLVLAGLLTALGIFTPTIFHLVGLGAGMVFLPMHIPVLLCGLFCGYRLGGLCGLLVPLLASLITSAPPLYPTAIIMMLELASYAIIAGLIYKKTNVFIALICAMLGGRVVFALISIVIMGLGGSPFVLSTFLTTAFITALPGIIIQILFVPTVVIFANRALRGRFSITHA